MDQPMMHKDLQDLVAKGALTRTGERGHTRYWLEIKDTSIAN